MPVDTMNKLKMNKLNNLFFRKLFFRYFSLLFLLVSFNVFAAQTQSFLTLADIHFDPFLSCHSQPCPVIETLRHLPATEWQSVLQTAQQGFKQQYWQDTSYPLLHASLDNAKQIAEKEHVKSVLVLGDFIAHEFKSRYRKFSTDKHLKNYSDFVDKTMMFLTNELHATFPSLDIYMVVGNNDSSQNNYVTVPGGIFFKKTAVTWSSLIHEKSNQDVMKQAFSSCGYYALDLPGESLRLIVLNTNLFSYKGKGRNLSSAAETEFAWLKYELSLAKAHHQPVMIAMHIPPTIDVYLLSSIKLFTYMHLWKQIYIKQFQALLDEYSTEIMAIYAGHLHSDWIHYLSVGQNKLIMSGTTSISPVFGNHPGFKVYYYSPETNQFVGSTSYVLSLSGRM